MADAKKTDKPAPPKGDPFVEIVSLLATVLFVIYAINGIVGFFTEGIFSRGWQGLTPYGIMLNHTRPINSLANPIGAKITTLSDSTLVYDSPAGKEIGKQNFNSRGKILQGFVQINGQKYWYVDFDKGADGWVKESDIAYLESEPNTFEKVLLWIWSSINIFKIISVFFSLAFLVWIAYLIVKLTKIRKNEYALKYPNVVLSDLPVNPKWEKILSHIESQNENDWKLAIIEADIMLDDILDKLNLPGETMGDKMKAVERSDFTTIDNAWEAHKIRNQIAHEGSDFVLTQREVKRVIGLYKSVFEEFQVI